MRFKKPEAFSAFFPPNYAIKTKEDQKAWVEKESFCVYSVQYCCSVVQRQKAFYITL